MSLDISDLQTLAPRADEAADLALATRRLTAKAPRVDRGTRRQPPVLGIGLPAIGSLEGVALLNADSPRAIIEMLRVLDFQVLLVGTTACKPAMWQTLAVVRQQWPHVRWILFSDDCSDQEEILARSHGVTAITTDPASIRELARG